jgi:N-methylhydantoinase B
VLGDIHALMAANDFGARRLQDYLTSQEEGALLEITDALAYASEQAVRTAIDRWPDGRYSAALWLDGFEEPKEIRVAVTVKGDRLDVDFTGTSRQSEFGINSGAPSIAYTLYSLKCLLTPEIPNNAWTYKPIHVHIPAGTLLNPTPPAPLSANFPAHLIQAVLYLALLDAAEGAVMAPSGAPMWVISFRGNANEARFASTLCFNGGQGSLLGRNGHPCLSMPSNVGNTPIETTEAELPIVYERKSIARGSGGAGTWAGGDGQEIVLRSVHAEALDVVFLTERIQHPAPGIAGGEPGRVGGLMVDDVPVAEPKGRARLAPGSAIYLRTPGGGGFGHPSARGATE